MTPRRRKKKIALILGSGFSKEARIPMVSEISTNFINFSKGNYNEDALNQCINNILKQFWIDVFDYDPRTIVKPSFEDHFTVLDLAANTGHHLGKKYSPKKLRAIRRMSIHRVFTILDSSYAQNMIIEDFLSKLKNIFDLNIFTLNWDIVVEKHLRVLSPIDYRIEIFDFDKRKIYEKGIPFYKLHGSANWVYCDSCRSLFSDEYGKTALHRNVYLEKPDFELFPELDPQLDNIDFDIITEHRRCPFCNNLLGARVATFSYNKDFSVAQFQTIWHLAHNALQGCDAWLFLGYSLPYADFEFKHLLKSAQLVHSNKPGKIEAVLLNDCNGEERYKQLFGSSKVTVYQCGFNAWYNSPFQQFIDNIS